MLTPASIARLSEVEHILCCECAVEIAKGRNERWIDDGYSYDQRQELLDNGYPAPRYFAKEPADG